VNCEDFGQVEIVAELRSLRAEHYHIEWICKIIDCGGNALPLRKMADCYDPKVACQKFSEKSGGDGEDAGDR
jgi:hypothetical protein